MRAAATGLLYRVRPRPSPGIRFEVAQRTRIKRIVQGLLGCQLAFATVGLLVRGPGAMAADPTLNAILGMLSIGFAGTMLWTVRRIRRPRRLELAALVCAGVGMSIAAVGQVENPAAGHAVTVYETVAVVFVAVVLPWPVRSAFALIGYTAVLAFAGIAVTVPNAQEVAALAGAVVFALAIAGSAAGFTWNARVERWLDERSIVALNAELRASSRRDGLTGLGNRQALERHLGKLAASDATTIGFAIVDIDRFKGINDAYGHLAGDDVLRMVARMIQAAIRSGDRVYRYGGEEFLVVLAGPAPGTVATVAERIRQAVLAPSLPNDTSEHRVLTASIGTSEVAGPATMAQVIEAIAVADQRLYAAKAGGRNVVVSDDVGLPDGDAAKPAPPRAPQENGTDRVQDVKAALAALEQVGRWTGRGRTAATSASRLRL